MEASESIKPFQCASMTDEANSIGRRIVSVTSQDLLPKFDILFDIPVRHDPVALLEVQLGPIRLQDLFAACVFSTNSRLFFGSNRKPRWSYGSTCEAKVTPASHGVFVILDAALMAIEWVVEQRRKRQCQASNRRPFCGCSPIGTFG